MEIFGITLVGINAENGKKLLYTLILLAMLLLRRGSRWLTRMIYRGRQHERVRFWTRQAISLGTTLLLILGLLSIWFDDPTRLATVLGTPRRVSS